MKKIKVFSIGIFTAINIIVAQVGQLSGVVSSESAEGLAGANVLKVLPMELQLMLWANTILGIFLKELMLSL